MEILDGSRVRASEDRVYVFLRPRGGNRRHVVVVGFDGSGQRTEAPARVVTVEVAAKMNSSMETLQPLASHIVSSLRGDLLLAFQTMPDVHDLLSGLEDSRYYSH